MRRILPFSPAILAFAALAPTSGCGHREGFEEAADRAFKTNTAGSTTSGSGGTGAAGAPNGDGLELVINGHDMVPGYWEAPDPQVDQTMRAMSVEQRIAQLQGVPRTDKPDYSDIERSPDVTVESLGATIRGYRYRDAGRGINLDAGQDNRPFDDFNYATVFPAPSVRAASFDMDLEWRVGFALGDETAASKNNMLLAPCMNIIRHPYWGRTQETYGEDPFHIGRMASAFTAGLQQHVVGCAKHFAANNVEDNRANQDALMSEQTLREIYGRHFEMVIRDGGVGCIMAAYNKINGVKSTQNAHLLTRILRDPYEAGGMAYRGLVLSDWWAMPGDQGPIDTTTATRDAVEAIQAGMDVEVPWTLHYGQLGAALSDDPSLLRFIDASARRVLEQKFRFKTAYSTDAWGLLEPKTRLGTGDRHGSIVGNEDHLELAEEVAIKSSVLLKNGTADDPVLPLEELQSVAVIGAHLSFQLDESLPPTSPNGVLELATHASLGDRGSSRVNGDPEQAVSPFEGVQMVASEHGVANVTSGTSAADAADADVVVVVVGLSPADEGEEYAIASGGDRNTLDLPAGQNQLVADVLSLGKPTIVVIESGSIVSLPWLDHANQQQATIWAGYPGLRGGAAIARLLFGDANFSAKMPMAWPREQDLLEFKTEDDKTNMGYFFGYREYDRRAAAGESVNLVFPFGHGLSYTSFEYSNLSVEAETVDEHAIFDVNVDITNTGSVDGEEVAMLFVAGPPKPSGIQGERNVKELKSFAKVMVPSGETVSARLPIRVQDFRHWEGDEEGRWVIDPGDYQIMVGPHAAALDLTQVVKVRP